MTVPGLPYVIVTIRHRFVSFDYAVKYVCLPCIMLTHPSAGFSIVDVLTYGAIGHGVGVGVVLGLKGIGAL